MRAGMAYNAAFNGENTSSSTASMAALLAFQFLHLQLFSSSQFDFGRARILDPTERPWICDARRSSSFRYRI